jgi:tRNA A-37 threonylcarbamoyl transferase component Bud32
LTAAIRGDWHDWWKLRTPLLRPTGVWPTKAVASAAIARGRQWWARRSGTAPSYSRVLELGGSQLSSVWAAVANDSNDVHQLVVLKGVCEARIGDAAATQRLLDEARLTARMNHPNVVAMRGLEHEGTRPVIVMEYLAGQSLATVLANAGDLREFSLEMRIAILARLLRGLDYVHGLRDFDGRPLRVVHGGVSPENVLVTYDGEVKLIDFGRARSRASALEDPLARRRLPYAPPEHFSGAPDLRGDIFSSGVILWELVANRPLWGRLPAPTLVRRLLAGDIPRLRDVVPTVDGELDRICARAVAPHPDARFQSAADLRGELEHYLAVRGVFVADAAIGALVSSACRELRQSSRRTMDTRIGELGLSLRLALPAHSVTATPKAAALERRQRTIAASIVAGAILIALMLCVALQRGPSSGTNADVDANVELSGVGLHAADSNDVAGSDASRLVRLDVRVQPAHALLSIDGRRLSSNPLRATMVWDPLVHTLRAEADGYEPFSASFRLDADVEIAAVLRPELSGAVRTSVEPNDEWLLSGTAKRSRWARTKTRGRSGG